ncbi:hypothetical protein BDQ17DRAFT_1506508 [Cyathus striatus]|nr:hypothetical protein BDQ17DRAFT_1506508 [Cyathus striatus]
MRMFQEIVVTLKSKLGKSPHKRCGCVYFQIATMGRTAQLSELEADDITLVGPSPIPLTT